MNQKYPYINKKKVLIIFVCLAEHYKSAATADTFLIAIAHASVKPGAITNWSVLVL